jgi:hypothetical protein
MRASLALVIREPPIDPLRSNKKMYYPLAESISVSKLSAFIASFFASYKLRLQNLGIKDTITVEPLSVLPRV